LAHSTEQQMAQWVVSSEVNVHNICPVWPGLQSGGFVLTFPSLRANVATLTHGLYNGHCYNILGVIRQNTIEGHQNNDWRS